VDADTTYWVEIKKEAQNVEKFQKKVLTNEWKYGTL
jgi:hypothetical protein